MAEQFECCTGRSSLLAAGSVIRVGRVVLLRVCIESGWRSRTVEASACRCAGRGASDPRHAGRVDRYFKSVSWSVYRDMTESEYRDERGRILRPLEPPGAQRRV